MQYAETWTPTKFVPVGGTIRGSRDPREVGVASRLVADLVADAYARHLPRYASGRLLDLGCGKVPLFGVYRDHVSETVCVDWSKSMHDRRHVDVEDDLTGPLPFEDEEFDTVLLSDVLEHLPDPATIWSEISRVLRPEGRFVMNVPFFCWLHEQPHDYFRYTEFALRRFCDEAGMRILELESLGGMPEIMGDLMAKMFVDLPGVGRPMARVTQWGVRRFVRRGPGRRISHRTRGTFPLAYFLVAERPARMAERAA